MERIDHILVVDDDRDIRELIVDYLEKSGYRASGAANGKAMWSVLKNHKIDLIVLDIMMPGEDGLTLCRQLRANPQQDIPVLMLTARTDDSDRILGLEMGADDYLIKQVNALKMQMDVSHMNEKAFWDTAHHSTSPLVATHSNAHALCPQPRNLTDQQLRAIRDSGGVVGVNFGNAFLRADGRRDSDTPLTTIVRHIDYLINIMGEDHVALGSDFDGITLPDELGDVAGLPRLINTLRASGYDQLVLDKLLWRNWLRVLKNVWQQ